MQDAFYKFKSSAHCKGNALFLILIAVALFAALSYAVTQSGRGSGSVDKEQAQLLAAQVVSAMDLVRQGAQRMILMGTPVAQVTCKAGGTDDCGGGSANGLDDYCTTGTTCLFAPEGGGLSAPQLPQDAFDFSSCTAGTSLYPNRFSGATTYNGTIIDGFNSGADNSVTGIGTAAADDNIQARCLKKSVCLAINKALGISGIPDATTTTPYDGGINGQWNFCVNRVGGSGAGYRYVVILNAN